MLGADIDGVDKTQDFVQKNIWYANSNKHAKQINLVNIGDKVAIKTAYVQKNNLPFRNYGCDVSCMKIKAIGEVIENLKNGRELRINWTLLPKERIIFLKTYRSTISCVRRTDVQQMVFENQIQNYNELEDIYRVRGQKQGNRTMEQKSIQNKKVVEQPLNRILFGAAGTGKTFNTINHALSIVEGKSLEELKDEKREKLKERFDKYKNQGRIKFVTFHQSFSYEDFVEGIRAETDEQGNLTYKVKSGVFKDICEKATGVSQQAESIDEIVEKFLDEITETPLELNTQQNKKFKVSYVGSGVTLQCQPLASEANATYYANISKIKNLLSGEKIDNAYNRSYIKAVAEYLKPNVKPVKRNETNQNYILIIDEINRGSISRIFGELITLIEDSKRAGADEELSVILPYSKQEFTVPNNVYIIGTMNSSDRSLTGLDIALRRRFTFIEMPPQPNLLKDITVDGVDIKRLLTVINQRIEVLLDRDHCIGHANFMVLEEQPTLENLAHIFKEKIIPQLQEYFFDDWAKINLILNGNGMLTSKPVDKSAIFPNVNFDDLGYFEDKKTWEIITESFDSIESFASIIQHG